MKMVDFDVAEYQYLRNTKIDEDIARLHYPQKYVLLEAFNEIYSLDIQDVTDTAFFLKLTDDAIKHYTRVEKKIMNENKKLKKENGELKKENKELQLTKNFWKEQCNHRINEYKNYYSINHCPCSADDFVHELKKIYKQSIKEKEELKQENKELKKRLSDLQKENYGNIDGIAFYQEENANLCEKISDLECENEELRQENKKIRDTINNKITEKGMNWYEAEDNSKEEKKANLQLNVLEEIRDELKEI